MFEREEWSYILWGVPWPNFNPFQKWPRRPPNKRWLKRHENDGFKNLRFVLLSFVPYGLGVFPNTYWVFK